MTTSITKKTVVRNRPIFALCGLLLLTLTGCAQLGGQAVSSIAPATFHASPMHSGTIHADYFEPAETVATTHEIHAVR